jgi:TonB family protein
MFERLVITNSEASQPNRKWYFLFSSAALCIFLVTALLISLFSAEISLGTDEFDMVQLISPVEPVLDEPPPSQPEVEPEPRLEAEQTISTAPVTRERPQRRINMARVDESPRSVPKKVSTQPNLYRERLANRSFDLGNLDLDVGANAPRGRTGYSGSGSGSGAGSSRGLGSRAKERESAPPPPPPAKKAPVRHVAKKRVTLGVINGKATSLPKPRYPATARAMNAKGAVRVRVLIDENGRVVSANAVAGHILLRNAAETAARDARFAPTLLSGEPVKVSGVIIYNFLS